MMTELFGNTNLLSVIALFLATVSAVGAGYHFSPGSSSKSPDGKWEVICKAPLPSEADARDLLLLKRVQGGVFELRRVEGNGCVALWSPDSSRIALTDRWASDRSDVLIHSVAHPRSGQSLARLFPRNAIPREELNGHCYFEAVKWLNGRHLQIKISGHRDEYPAHGFEYEFTFDVASGGFKKVTKKKPNQSMERTRASRFSSFGNALAVLVKPAFVVNVEHQKGEEGEGDQGYQDDLPFVTRQGLRQNY